MTLLDIINQKGINKRIDNMQETYKKTLKTRTREKEDNIINQHNGTRGTYLGNPGK